MASKPEIEPAGWESRQWFWLAVGVLLAWLVWKLAPVLTPFVVSAALAYVFDPLTDRLENVRIGRWRWGRTFAVVLVFVLMIGIFTLLLVVFIPMLRDQIQQLIARTPEYLEWLGDTAWPWLQQTLGLPGLEFDVATITESLKEYWQEASKAVFAVLGTVSEGGQAIFAFLINLVLVPVVTFYLLRDWDKLLDGILGMLPRRYQPKVAGLAAEIDDVLGAFIRGQLIVMLALGLIYSFGLWAIGLDLAFIIGLTAGLLSVVPYLGTFVGVVAALLAATFQFQDIVHVVMVAAVFVVGQMLEGMVLTPKLVGDRIGLHPVAVIFAVLAGGQLAGFLGILLALPVAAALNVLVRHIHGEYRKSAYYEQEPAESEGGSPDDDPPSPRGHVADAEGN